MPEQQLLYELRETVFDYMEPNFRFQVTLQLPSLRLIEKRTQLNINRLLLTDNEISIAKTRYVFSIDRKYKKEKLPLRKSGSVDHDVDEFGFKTFTKDIMMNGDVCMENNNATDMETYERFRLGEEKLGMMEAMKKKEPPECKSTLKLTIISENEKQWIYKSSKITQIYEGMKMLIATLFGNRKVIWNVESMIISTGNLRWIVSGVKPFVRKLKIGCYHYVNLDGLLSICHPTSFPLRTLGFEMDHRILNHEILVKADYLIIRSQLFRHGINSLNILKKVSNQKVRLSRISEDTVAGLMEFWLEHGRPVGTSWSFEVQEFDGEEPSRYVDILRENDQIIDSNLRSIKLSMGPSSILSVSYDDPIFQDPVNRREIWRVKMEVLQR